MAVATFPHSNIPAADQAVRPGPALRRPACSDAARIHQLVAACKPLDLNSTYAYLLLCHHHADTCVLAEEGGRIVGFVSAYRPPGREGEIFIWQVAVAAGQRGRGLGRRMLTQLLARPGPRQRLRTCAGTSGWTG